jgi:hypothetical protein
MTPVRLMRRPVQPMAMVTVGDMQAPHSQNPMGDALSSQPVRPCAIASGPTKLPCCLVYSVTRCMSLFLPGCVCHVVRELGRSSREQGWSRGELIGVGGPHIARLGSRWGVVALSSRRRNGVGQAGGRFIVGQRQSDHQIRTPRTTRAHKQGSRWSLGHKA